MTQVRTPTHQPRGWERLVGDLNSAPDAQAFFRGMLDLQCKIVAAEYGAIWLPAASASPESVSLEGDSAGSGKVSLRPVVLWPEQVLRGEAEHPIQQLMLQAAQAGFERQTSQILRIDPEGVQVDPSGAGAHIFVTMLRAGGKVVGVSTVVADCRDASVLQSTAPQRELAAGLTEGFAARQEALQRATDAQLVRRTMAILATCQDGKGLNGSTLNFVNDLARQLKCTRVSVGWIHGRGIKLLAMSDTDHLRRHSEQVAQLERAMAECLDQQQPLVCPVPDGAEPLLAQSVLHSHRKLTGDVPNRHVLSIPLRQRDEWVGVLTLERSDDPFDTLLIRQMQMVADTVAPHLADRKRADRWLYMHVWESILEGGEYLLGPRHVAWKMLAVAVFLTLLASLIIRMDYRVNADFVIEARSKRIIPAPYQAKLDEVYIEPGKPVKAGQVLAKLETSELSLQLVETRAKLKQAMLQRDQHMAKREQGDAAQAAAEADSLQARVALLEYQIDQAQIRAPIDGIVLAGYWHDKVGGVIEQGKEMFQVAPLKDMVAIVRAPESDIDHLQVSQKGYIATRSNPDVKFPVTVSKIVPMASPVNGANVFEVWAELDAVDAITAPMLGTLRPGMEGLAKIRTEPRTLAWIATHRLADMIRLYVWW